MDITMSESGCHMIVSACNGVTQTKSQTFCVQGWLSRLKGNAIFIRFNLFKPGDRLSPRFGAGVLAFWDVLPIGLGVVKH
jgi:hypothetical protein